ncbi:queuosine precursor transporter [bacterium SCSIO 12741]|nr:queuosine precursor transporter [bacterium SCSIO 12741]
MDTLDQDLLEKSKVKAKQADALFLALAALFITALVTCNLIANKFISVDLGFKTFIISAGVLPYPITFLITDVLSEIYGRRKTSRVVLTGLAASLFVLFILLLGSYFPSIDGSPVDNATYDQVFANSWRVIFASMTAYLVAQLVDVRVFHFWKKLTQGKHLWLRNNASTIFSQFLDTFLVVGVLFVGVKSFGEIGDMVLDGWMFKALAALIDTPIFYGLVYFLRSYFGLKPGEELSE